MARGTSLRKPQRTSKKSPTPMSDMAPSLSVEQESHDSTENPADILNDLALNPGQTSSTSVGTGASEGRKYPTRGRRQLEQDVEPLRTSARIAGRLNRPSNWRARSGNGENKKSDDTNQAAPKSESFSSVVVTNSSNEPSSSSRAEAEKPALEAEWSGINDSEVDSSDADSQEDEASVQEEDEASVQEEDVDQDSSTLQENPNELPEFIELFGEDPSWEEVLEGARNVGVSKEGPEDLPKLRSSVIKKMVKTTKLAKRLFILQKEDDELTVDLRKVLEEIDEQVTSLNEPADKTRASVAIRDVYAHAIPQLVFMLHAALRCRTTKYEEEDDTEALETMISIQNTILLLCEKAASWNAKARHKTPIVRPTRNKIKPNLVHVRKAFNNELMRRTGSSTDEQNERMLAEAHERRLEKLVKQNEANERNRKENAIKIREELEQTMTRLGLQHQKQQHQAGHDANHQDSPIPPPTPEQWTAEQDLALIIELQNPESRHLPAPQRYSAIVASSTALRGKSPEQVRDRALHFKAAMQQAWGHTDYVESIL